MAEPQITIMCETCGQKHVAEHSHEGLFDQGPIYASVCPQDNLTDYWTAAAAMPDRQVETP